MTMIIDTILEGKRRRLRTNPEKVLMDASGLRLWADYLDVEPGFSGRIDFIHKINIPSLFRIRCSAVKEYEPSQITWKPSHITLSFEKEGIRLKERKFITIYDTAVSCMTWENTGNSPFTLFLELGTEDGSFPTTYGKRLAVRLFCNGERIKEREWAVSPGEKKDLCVAVQICLEEETERMESACGEIGKKFRSGKEGLDIHIKEYQSWFDKTPEFISDNPVIDKTWAYRWFIFRHNMMEPGIGNLKERYFCEGRSHKMSKTPYKPEGWEFSKLIPLSVPMHLLDLRWYQDKEYGRSILHTMRDNQDETGEFHCARADGRGNPYANFFGWSVWQYYLVSGEKAFAQEALPVVKKQREAWKKVYGNEEDSLLIQYVHQLTGMEYQPSYWYFHDFPLDCRDEKKFTPLKRVDRNVYHYLNTLATAYLCGVCGDPEEERYRKEAEEIKKDILEKMWDGESGFFYDLHYQTDEKAYVKNIVGAFPFFAGITDENHVKCMETLFSEEFDTGCPFPSVSKECKVFTPEGGWMGQFFKGRNGCIWDGPAWPYANSIILDGIGRESLAKGHEWDEEFGRYFMKFTRLHYYGGDGETPYLVEHYNSMSGECISDDVDYSHSYYIDLVVKYIAGISVYPGKIVVEPLDIGLEHFCLNNLTIQGHDIRVCLEKENRKLTVSVDGEERGNCEGLGRLEVIL